jgi:hypothetical protein
MCAAAHFPPLGGAQRGVAESPGRALVHPGAVRGVKIDGFFLLGV